jgi:hypothetical protein
MKNLIYFAAMILILSACERQDGGVMYLTSDSDLVCRSGGGLKTDDPLSNQSCIRFEYDGDSTLYMVHLNAGFNCCPEEILVDMEVKGDSILITENQRKAGCRCNCLFHVNLTVHNLERTKYHVKVMEPLARVDNLLMFDLDLKKEPNGQVCVERSYYPWNQ